MVVSASLKKSIYLSIFFMGITAVLFLIFIFISIKTEINITKDLVLTIKGFFTNKGNVIDGILAHLSNINKFVLLETIILGCGFLTTLFALYYLFVIYFKNRQFSLIDELTQIYNRKALEKQLDKEIKRAERFKHPLTIIMIDIDFFKVYNDKNGHVAGDELLKKIAGIFKKNVRNVDIVARYGGEEFTIILPETTHKGAVKVAEKIRKTVEKTKFRGEKNQPKGKITISMGLATFHGKYREKKEMIHSADQMLYQAKENGRNQLMKTYFGIEPEKNNIRNTK